ncbi:MAG: GtrA family protein [Clostridia bacterium]|nr:GtrA family protein [Clostridia bacterium]
MKRSIFAESACWLRCGFLLYTAAVILLYLLVDPAAAAAVVCDWLSVALRAVIGVQDAQIPLWIGRVALHTAACGGTCLLCRLSTWRHGVPARRSILLCAGLCAVLAPVPCIGALLRGGPAAWIDALLCLGCSGCVLLAILLWCAAWRRFPQWLNRETVTYVVFGALTTLINVVLANLSYQAFLTVMSPVAANLASNVLAWTGAVIFAFFVNRIFVFRSHTRGRQALRECGLFMAARLFSFAIDAAGMVLLVDGIGCPYGFAKIAMNIIVLILNYIFSKKVIFRPPSQNGRRDLE